MLNNNPEKSLKIVKKVYFLKFYEKLLYDNVYVDLYHTTKILKIDPCHSGQKNKQMTKHIHILKKIVSVLGIFQFLCSHKMELQITVTLTVYFTLHTSISGSPRYHQNLDASGGAVRHLNIFPAQHCNSLYDDWPQISVRCVCVCVCMC